MNFDKELDARGLNCPLPILRAKKSLAEMTTGQVLRIIAGNELLSSAENNKEFEFYMKRK